MKSFHYPYRVGVIAVSLLFGGALSLSGQQQPLSLQEAVTLARKNNPELKASAVEIEKSQAQKVIARSLFLPTVTASAGLNHYFQLTPFFGFGSGPAEGKIPYGRFGGEDQFGAVVSATQPIFSPQASPAFQRARVLEQQAHVALTGKEVAVLSSVKQTYLQLLVLQERIRLQQESINRNKRVLRDSRALFLQGKGLRVDTLRAFTSVKNLEPELLKLSYAVETRQLQLKTLIGIDSLNDFVLTDSLILPDPGSIPDEETVYQEARQHNPEFQLLALQQQESDHLVRQAAAARLPVLSAVGQYQVQSQTNDFEYGNAYYPSASFVGVQLTAPLFNGFSSQAKVRQAKATKTQSILRLKNANEQLRVTVHQAVANGHESLARLQTTESVKETAALSYTIIQYRYTNGIASRLELTDAELSLTAAQSNYLEAVYDYLTASIDLMQIMGRAE